MSASVGAKSLKSASLGNREIKAIFLGGGRVWAKIRTITFNRGTGILGRTTIKEEHYRSGDKSLIAEWLDESVKFAAPVTADYSVNVGGKRYYPGDVIPAGVGAKRWGDSELTFTEAI